jgi:hypothetical protein
MNVILTQKDRPWNLFRCPTALLFAFFCCCFVSCLTLPLRAADVADCDPVSLQDAIDTGDGVVTFTEDCEMTLTDTISLTGDLIIDAQGHTVTISGDGTFLLFEVTNATLQVYGISFSGGSNTNGGAFFIDDVSTVVLSNCTFTGNVAQGTNGVDGVNGANSSTGNGGSGTNGRIGGPGCGGAIYSLGSLGLLNCTFASNSVTGGTGGNGGNGGSGAFNAGNGGGGASGGLANGGAIYHSGTNLVVSNCTFAANSTQGGNGGTGGTKGSSGFGGLDGNGATGAAGSGAAIYSTSPIIVVNSTFNDNSAQGGNSANGGTQANGNGTAGPNGGNSFGGGIYALGSSVTNCTFFNNNVAGGAGGNGGNGSFNAGNGGNGGNATGGGLYSSVETFVVSCTFSNCNATGGSNGVAGSGIGGSSGSKGLSHGGDLASGGGSFNLASTILATNSSGGAGFGTIHDAGYNITFGNTITLASGSGSFKTNNVNLDVLADNGGPTKTMALKVASPARDRVPLNFEFAVDQDQRGFPRGINGTNDIGAFEYQAAGVPVFVRQPTNAVAQVGSNATFFVTVGGATPFTYGLTLNGTVLTNLTKVSSSTSTTLIVTNATTTNSGPYRVTVRNSFGSTNSNPIDINFSPTIITNPVNETVAPGAQADFTVAALGDAPLFYQWQFGGTNIDGANGTRLSIINVQNTNIGPYTVAITNSFGSITSAPALLNLLVAIQTQPASQTVPRGSNVTFSVVAAGSPPLAYQWRFNGTASPGQTNSSYTINGVQTSQAGNYDVIVTNQFNSVTSSVATLTVQAGSSTTLAQPKVSGSNFTFTFTTESGFTYISEYRTNLVLGSWVPFATNSGSGSSITVTNSTTNGPSRFFRVRVQ